MKPTQVRSNRHYGEILEWLQTNVGTVLWSHPIITWHGNGWHMKRHTEVMPRGVSNNYYIVEFEDPKMATLFALWT